MPLTCLLPARNVAGDLPGYLESAARFTERVIALDDGSTDATPELLEASALVTTLLRNPQRRDYGGWNDAANRQQLLDAAIAEGADWVLYLDADERIDADDAAALRELVERDAIRGCAYGLQMYRAWGERVEARPTYVYRLFGPAPGQRLPEDPLHFTPVPEQIARSKWLRTTIRARHLESNERLELRRRKYGEADPEERWGLGGRTPLAAPTDLIAWRARPAGISLLAVGAEGERAALPGASSTSLTCLLPARNAAGDLPGYLESAARFTERVIALDDGSTDATPELLEASALVTTLLRNPQRRDYGGWNDAANRQQLLDAAIAEGADWVLYLDADERIDADDAEALREFVKSAADPGAAYGFRVFRMLGDAEHFDRAELWVYRLFRARDGQTLPARPLHLVPIPVEIPRARWLKTTVRVQHLAGLTPERRSDRLRKYEEADPKRRWQRDYSGLVTVGRPRRRWVPRPSGLPVLADRVGRRPGAELDLAELDPGSPLLSAIVISRNDVATIEGSVRAVVEQEGDEPFEVIVAASGDDGTAALVRERFPSVTVVDVPEPGLPGTARNAGLGVALGEFVSFPGSHVELPAGSLAARIRAHELGYSMVTGSILNGTDTPAGWAAYFLDHSASLPDRPSGELDAVPAHCSYTREALLEVGRFPEDMRAGEDTIVNRELWRRGHRAYRAQDIELVHRNPCSTPWRLARHHFLRGRALGRILLDGAGAWRNRRGGLSYLRSYPRWRLGQTDFRVAEWGGDLSARYRRVRRLVVLGTLAACAGAALELLIRRDPKAGTGPGGDLRGANEPDRGPVLLDHH